MSNDAIMNRMKVFHPDRREKFEQMFGLMIVLTPRNGKEMDRSDIGFIPIGSHLAVKCDAPILFHHGIYVGIQEEKHRVIHFAGDTKDDAVITKGTIPDFLGNSNTFFLIGYEGDTTTAQELTVAVAEFLHENLHFEGIYDVFSCNCETFAIFCRTGEMRSFAAIEWHYISPSKLQKNILTRHFWTGRSNAKK